MNGSSRAASTCPPFAIFVFDVGATDVLLDIDIVPVSPPVLSFFGLSCAAGSGGGDGEGDGNDGGALLASVFFR